MPYKPRAVYLTASNSQPIAGELEWVAIVTPGQLVLRPAGGDPDDRELVFDLTDQLRDLGMQTHAAAVRYDLDVETAAAKATVARRASRAERAAQRAAEVPA